MNRFLIIVGASVGGWLGWSLGEGFGLFTGFILSTIGSGVGWILALKVIRAYGW